MNEVSPSFLMVFIMGSRFEEGGVKCKKFHKKEILLCKIIYQTKFFVY